MAKARFLVLSRWQDAEQEVSMRSSVLNSNRALLVNMDQAVILGG